VTFLAPISKNNAPHREWGSGCDAWVLCPSADMTVVQERMPPRTCEKRHFHAQARQFFYVLSGWLTMEIEGRYHLLGARNGMEVAPGQVHQARNEGPDDLHFLVISSATTRDDRTDV
jgi:mannose-6-phosphate isomerase-like protein (cupin superfamily)